LAKRVAVEDTLSDVKRALKAQGFDVTKLTNGQMTQVDCAVISGQSENLMGIQDTNGNKFPVIDCRGMTAQEVVSLVQSRCAVH
jgi:hypothetical protein